MKFYRLDDRRLLSRNLMHLIAITGISASILNDIEFLRNLLRRKQDKNVGFLKLFAEENSENEAVAKEFYEALIAYSILYIQNLTGKMDGLFETEIKDGENRKTEIQREKIQKNREGGGGSKIYAVTRKYCIF